MPPLLSPRERVVILGAGPTGLGAAHRLLEHGHRNFAIYEATDRVGGLAASHRDHAGFTWDLGGHVQFSHYHYFRDLMDELLGDAWLTHERVASVWLAHRWVPYPLQQHLRFLPPELRERCERSWAARDSVTSPTNFRAWILGTFGEALAELFMLPYNFKVWAYPPELLSPDWVGDRVAQVPQHDDAPWGPNRTFRFPAEGGTGAIWQRLAARLPADHLHLRHLAVATRSREREVRFENGSSCRYDRLLSTMPLDRFVAQLDQPALLPLASRLAHSSVHVLGVALRAPLPEAIARQCWMYFPGDDCPFYRATVFSNYSPHNVPNPSQHASLMVEVAESPHKPVDEATLEAQVIDGLLATGLIHTGEQVMHVWRIRLEHGYPTPTLTRDSILAALHGELEPRNIFSRGRFGGWKYEVSNQDHSLMQGVEWVDRLVRGTPETTLHDPQTANAPGLRPSPEAP